MSVDRDALAGLILAATADAASMIFPGTADYLADELLAAGYRKPRTIVTADGLEALPNGAVILSEQGGVWSAKKARLGRCRGSRQHRGGVSAAFG
ncbi:hypothetical protein HJ581_0043590 [Rhodococcus opacus]|nr:hypothetical protein HJ581_0043590 [Rhodococcus opacus]